MAGRRALLSSPGEFEGGFDVREPRTGYPELPATSETATRSASQLRASRASSRSADSTAETAGPQSVADKHAGSWKWDGGIRLEERRYAALRQAVRSASSGAELVVGMASSVGMCSGGCSSPKAMPVAASASAWAA